MTAGIRSKPVISEVARLLPELAGVIEGLGRVVREVNGAYGVPLK